MLFLDFWGMGCGPCRSGMIRQKPMLEKLSNRPFNALYIADGDDGMEACKKWLRKEGIKGEHILFPTTTGTGFAAYSISQVSRLAF